MIGALPTKSIRPFVLKYLHLNRFQMRGITPKALVCLPSLRLRGRGVGGEGCPGVLKHGAEGFVSSFAVERENQPKQAAFSGRTFHFDASVMQFEDFARN